MGCILLTVVFIFNYKREIRYQLVTLFFLFVSLLLTITYAISDYFTDKGIDESVIYHLRYGLGDAGFEEYAGIIAGAVLALAAIAALCGFFIKIVIRGNSKNYEKSRLVYLPVIFSGLAIIINPASDNIYDLLQAEFFKNTIDHADYIKVSEVMNKPPLNLIYIYAESLEETYFDETLFPGLMPNLNKVRNKAIVFKDVAQVTHSGWTIAGMVASQCGVPLFSASQGNAMSGMPKFLSGATCLGDVLHRNKYSLSYLGGASLDFAGKGNFYKTHGFSSVQGRKELSEQLIDSSYKSAWGLYDDSLLNIAKQKLVTEAAQDRPFALFMLTLDTHHPKGHSSANCEGHHYADGSNDILNAVHCSDNLISEFVDYIYASGLEKNTLIVIGSDHLAMKNTASNILNQGDRKNMLIMIPPGLEEGQVVKTPSSILDVSATILPLLGFEAEALGFGRNILNTNIPQLIGQHENFNSYLNSASSLVSSFWQYPRAVNNVQFDDDKKLAYFGQQEMNYPALFLIDNNNETEQVIFEFNSEKKLSEYVQEQEQGQKLFWIDQCSKLNAVFKPNTAAHEQQNCVAIGRLGSDNVWVKPLAQKTKLTKNKITAMFKKQPAALDAEHYLNQLGVLKRIAVTGVNAATFSLLPKDSGYQSVFVKSASGINNGESFVTYTDESGETKLQGLKRGLNLVGFTQGKSAEIIQQFDTCQYGDSVSNEQKMIAVLNQYQHEFYLLIVHDSAVCASDDGLQQYMQGSSLKSLVKLGWRQAYAAIIYQDGTSLELLGKNGQPVNVILKQ